LSKLSRKPELPKLCFNSTEAREDGVQQTCEVFVLVDSDRRTTARTLEEENSVAVQNVGCGFEQVTLASGAGCLSHLQGFLSCDD
jgi:hypothetical protein